MKIYITRKMNIEPYLLEEFDETCDSEVVD